MAAADKVWYFAYGSNMKLSVMERRGVTPLAVERLVIPSHHLTFDIFGLPYTEPAMASIAGPEDAARDAPPVHGVGYLLSAGDFADLVVSEGAGTAYREAELEARRLLDHDDGYEGAAALTVRTLVARYPFRPNPLPSTRYLGLLLDGAREHRLPAEYQDYLASLPGYTKAVSRTEEFGARLFLGFWMPIVSWTMGRIKVAGRQGVSGRRSRSAVHALVVWLLFNAVWLHYDFVHCWIWGHGGGRRR